MKISPKCHIKFQIYSEIFLQLLCWLLRKKKELYHCWKLFTRSKPKLFWFSKSRNHEFQFFLLFIIVLYHEGGSPWRKSKIPIYIWLICKKILKISDTKFLIENWIQRYIVWIVISNNALIFSTWDRFLQSFLIFMRIVFYNKISNL